MKFKTKQRKINWKKILIVLGLLGIVGYRWYIENRPLSDQQTIEVTDQNGELVQQEIIDVKDYLDRQDSEKQKEFLTSIGDDQLQSPAGLIYGKSGGEHRVDHVMRHTRDNPSRPSHGVFQGDKETVLKLIDEAYEMIKSESRHVESEKSRGNMAYTVSMGRKIGYEGGQKGQRNGNRELRGLRLVLDGNQVITAYPYR